MLYNIGFINLRFFREPGPKTKLFEHFFRLSFNKQYTYI